MLADNLLRLGRALDPASAMQAPAQPLLRQVDTVGRVSKGDVVYDRREQLKQIQSGLLDGEDILAVYDAIGTGTGFIGLTDRRVIIQDKSFVGQKIAITSIPYVKITSVSVVSNKSWAGAFFSTGAIAINVGTHVYEVQFRGSHKSHHVHNVILHYISQR